MWILLAWFVLLAVFWPTSRTADAGPLQLLIAAVDDARHSAWAPAVLLGLYAARPFLLIPIALANLASGFILGPAWGIAMAMVGTLVSAPVGYIIGRTRSRSGLADDLLRAVEVRLAAAQAELRQRDHGRTHVSPRRSGQLPRGAVADPFPTFLLGIAIGNLLTMSTAVLTGASVGGDLTEASVKLEPITAAGSPVFAVLGNHDYGMPTKHAVENEELAAAVRSALEDVGIRVLQNEAVTLPSPSGSSDDPLFLVGVGAHVPGYDEPDTALAELPT